MFFLVLIAATLAAGVAYQFFGVHRDLRRYPPPGRIVDTGCVRLHVHEQGAGAPAAILESGIAASSLSWALVQPKIAEFTQVASYDRAGLGWSAPCKQTRTVPHLVSELDAVLSRAAIPPPYILVGHSFGALVVRAYAALHSEEVAALVLVDPVSLRFWADCHPRELRRLQLGAKLSRRGAWLARFGVVRLALDVLASGGRRVPKLVARATSGQGATVLQNLAGEIRKLPSSVWPFVRAHWSRPACFRAMAAYLESLPESAKAALRMPVPGNIPLIILSASSATPGELQERDAWVRESSHGEHIRIENSGHWLQLEYPDLVVAAVRRIFDAITSPR